MCHCRTYAEVCDGIYKKDVTWVMDTGWFMAKEAAVVIPKLLGLARVKCHHVESRS